MSLDEFGTAVEEPAANSVSMEPKTRERRIVIKERGKTSGRLVQWTNFSAGRFIACSHTQPALFSGVYTVEEDNNCNPLFCEFPLELDDSYYFTDSIGDRIIKEIENFWESGDNYVKHGYCHRRGYLLYGPVGSGKSVIVQQAIERVTSREGIVVLCDHPGLLTKALHIFRVVEPERKVLCIFEDIDSIVLRHGEASLLALLDGEGQINRVLNLATCYSPEARMFTTDLRWVPCGDLHVGDELWAFDEERPHGRGARRRYRRAKVLVSQPGYKECVRVCLNTGESFICSIDHPWLSFGDSQTKTQRLDWTLAIDLLKRPNLVRPFIPWNTERSWEAGWLAGILDGEGCICRSGTTGRASHVSVAQNMGITADRMADAITRRVKAHVYPRSNRPKQMVADTLGGIAATAKLVGQVRAERLIEQFDISGGMMHNKFPSRVVAVEYLGVHEVQSIQTTSQTYIAEGFASHNTNYPEKLDKRIVARPRRFDRVIKVGMPPEDVRRSYFLTKLGTANGSCDLVEKLVKATDGFSFAAMAEAIISIKCLGNDFEKTIETLRKMIEHLPSSDEYNSKEMGFGSK